MSRFSWWSALAIALAVAADLVVVTEIGQPWRGAAVFAFLLLGPGLPIAGLLRLRSAVGQLTVGIALSLALDTAVAETMVMAKVWSAGTALAALIFLAVAVALIDLVYAPGREGTVRAE